MKEEPQPLEYARPPDALTPDVSNLPAYKRYSSKQLLLRWCLAVLICAGLYFFGIAIWTRIAGLLIRL